MMHRCSSSNHAVGGACTCGVYHHTQTNNNSFSMLFSMTSNHKPFDNYEYSDDMYPFGSPPSYSSSVDCTLSLGTPSTRRTCNSNINNNATAHDHDHHKREVVLPQHDHHHHRRSSFCWDILQNKQHASSPPQSHRNSSAAAGDSLLARRCANCDTTSTPLWRNGPRGPKSLCNACGIRFKKEERRSATASGPNGVTAAGAASGLMEPQQHMINNSWVPQYSHQSQKVPCFSPSTAAGNEFRFIDGGGHDSDSGIPFLSWRLNVADRPGLVHDFTR